MRPGSTVRPRASISCVAPGSSGAMALMRPSSIAMSAVAVFSVVTIVPPRTTRSVTVHLPLFKKMHTGVKRCGHVFDQHVFVRMMAHASWGAQKQHNGGNFCGQNHGIVSCAAGHAVDWVTGSFHRLFQSGDHGRIHGNCRLVELLLPFQ